MNIMAQNSTQQIEFKIENDKLVLTDRYYTNGLFLTYRKKLDNDFIFKKTSENALQFDISLGNETYTPTNLLSEDTRDFDRPYAGWFFTNATLKRVTANTILGLGVEAGITGEEALSGKLQTLAHEFFNIERPTWVQEIEFKFLVNLKAQYSIAKTLGKMQAIQYNMATSLGTKDIYVSNSLEYTFGKFNALIQSSRNGIIDTEDSNEFYGVLSLGYRYVLHNTLLQGSLDFNDQTFTVTNTPHIFEIRVGSTLKIKRNTFRLMLNFNTKETPLASSHAYGTLSFGGHF